MNSWPYIEKVNCKYENNFFWATHDPTKCVVCRRQVVVFYDSLENIRVWNNLAWVVDRCIFCVVIIGDVSCSPGFFYFFALEAGRQGFVKTVNKTVAQEACQDNGGILVDGRNGLKYLSFDCYLTLLGENMPFIARRVWDFGTRGNAPSQASVVCIRKFAILNYCIFEAPHCRQTDYAIFTKAPLSYLGSIVIILLCSFFQELLHKSRVFFCKVFCTAIRHFFNSHIIGNSACTSSLG